MNAVTNAIKDADGKTISVGSVLRNITDNEQGVVTRIAQAGSWGFMFEQVGDITIQKCPGSYRVTNRYDQWRHVPRSQQTYAERYLSWVGTPFDKKLARLVYGEELSDDAAIAIDGIMSLLPEDAVCWEEGPWPDSIEQALRFLSEHLSNLSKKP